ncbi:MAG: short-chain dehydrogenase [Verrucomicrobiales bacterium]|nr:short-chain dehydrogenase [Verrucomicrobiales bacterium]|tara:strand:+ start:7863 stop:8648 length:786 start_codon:yes stop_codon:yes gene_type:complete
MDLQLKDRVVIVTGGSKGIGAAAVRAFAAEGARVAIAGRSPTEGQALAKESGGIFIEAQLAEESACRRVIEETLAAFNRIDVLVNNAGFNDGKNLDTCPEEFMTSVNLNLSHVYTLTHLCREELIRNKGAIINVSSKVAATGQGQTSGYAAAKGAMNALTREWAIAFASHNVRVNCVIPAECITPQYQNWFDTLKDPAGTRAAIEALVPLNNRMTTPEELADTIVFLASPRSSHTTGQLIYVDGGYTHLDRAASADHSKWG